MGGLPIEGVVKIYAVVECREIQNRKSSPNNSVGEAKNRGFPLVANCTAGMWAAGEFGIPGSEYSDLA